MVLSLFALVVIVVLVAVALLLAAWLGGLPGRIATARDHPQADAIDGCGWLGLITLGAPWIVAMVWAFTKPVVRPHEELVARVAQLERELAQLPNGTGIMIAFLTLCYCGLVWLVFFKLKVLKWNAKTQGSEKVSGTFIPPGLYCKECVS